MKDTDSFNPYESEGTDSVPMSCSSLNDWYRDRLAIVKEGILDFLRKHYNERIADIASYAACGGKCIRGALTMLICEAYGGNAWDALSGAVAVELSHAASLAHDDIVDGDVQRRGKMALHIRYGLPAAILVPHLIVPHSIMSAEVYGPGAVSIILKAWSRVVRGQIREYLLEVSHRERTNRENAGSIHDRLEYWRIIRDKTAALFETAAVLGAMAAGVNSEAPAVVLYARRLGMAYQIADDVIDLQMVIGKPIASTDFSRLNATVRAMVRAVSTSDGFLITDNTTSRAKHLALAIVRRSENCAAAFPNRPVRELARAFPLHAIRLMWGQSTCANSK